MSRSKPQDSGTPNPAARWFEWNGETGTVRYYDKEKKENVDVGTKFQFVLLDQLATVRGWHDKTQSGIYANEVKDTTADPLIVRAFKGGTLVEGFYRDIKDRVRSLGGQFVANCYIAFKNADGELALGSLRFKGAALGAWMEFSKANRADLYAKAVRITGFTEGKKGRIVYRMPVLKIVDLTKEANNAAVAIDLELQRYLEGYLRKNTREQVEAPAQHEEAGVTYDHETEPPPPTDADMTMDEDEVPF